MDPEVFDQQLLAKIKEEKISPKPRWHFLLKDYVIWISGTVALFIGAAAFSVMMYLFKYNDFPLQMITHKNFWDVLLLTLPYFWIIFLGIFIFILYYNLKHTKKGYRYPVWFITVISVFGSMLLGAGLFALGLGEKIDSVLGKNVPSYYGQFFNRQIDFWSHPDDGRLTGLVVSGTPDGKILFIVDRHNSPWMVDISDASFLPGTIINIGEPIRLVGTMSDDNKFKASKILPLGPGREFFRRFDAEYHSIPGEKKNIPFDVLPDDSQLRPRILQY